MKKITFIIIILVFITATAQKKNTYNFEGFVEKANDYINAIANKKEFSGTILVAYKGEIKFHKGYGQASKRFNIPNTTKTKFRVGSVTKSFTAMCILKLAEEGKLSLDDPLANYLKNYPFADKIKIKHLLSHTSGIKRDIQFPDKHKKYGLDELVKMSEVDSLLYNPGTKMTYSNCGYILLQSIIEQITGQDYESYVTQNILKPMGLNSTGIENPLLPPVGLADGFDSGTDKNGNYALIESHMLSHRYPDAVGAMYSTTKDLMLFSRQIGKSNVLKPETWKMALTRFLDNNKKGSYNWGYGFNIIKGRTTNVYNHNGKTTGFRCGYFQIVEDDLTIIILGNYGYAVREAILSAFQRILTGRPYYQPEILEEIDGTKEDYKEYAGTYQTKDFPFEVLNKNGALYVQSHGDAPVKMLPYEKDAFFCEFFDLRIKFIRKEEKIIGCDWLYKNTSSEAGKVK